MTQQDMYAKGGPSVATIRTLEVGEQAGYRNRTYFQIEESLGWAAGSVDRILAGGEPKPHTDARDVPTRDDSATPSLVTELRARALAEGRTVGEVLAGLGLDAGELAIPEQQPEDPIIAAIEADEYVTREQKDRLIQIYLDRRAEVFEAEWARRERERERDRRERPSA